MAKISSSLTVTTPSGQRVSSTYSKEANSTLDREIAVLPGQFVEVFSIDTSQAAGDAAQSSANILGDYKQLIAFNVGDTPLEVALKTVLIDDADSINHAELYSYPVFNIPVGGYLSLPSPRIHSVSGTRTTPVALNYVDNARVTAQAILRATASTATYVSGDGKTRKVNLRTNGLTDSNGDLYISGLHGKANYDNDSGGGGTAGTYVATDGIIPGTIRVNFYSPAFQEFSATGNALKPFTSTSSSLLTANTAYAFGLNVNGGGATDISFTTHTSDVTWGSPLSGTGVLYKIQAAMDAAEKGCDVSLVNGNIRFSSRSRNSTSSAIAITAPSSGTDFRDAGILSNGLIATTAVSAMIQDDDDVMFDDGEGNLSRKNGGSGWCVYGAPGSDTSVKASIYVTGAPTNSSVKLSWLYGSTQGGKLSSTTPTDDEEVTNSIMSVYARANSFHTTNGKLGRKGKLRMIVVDKSKYTQAADLEA